MRSGYKLRVWSKEDLGAGINGQTGRPSGSSRQGTLEIERAHCDLRHHSTQRSIGISPLDTVLCSIIKLVSKSRIDLFRRSGATRRSDLSYRSTQHPHTHNREIYNISESVSLRLASSRGRRIHHVHPAADLATKTTPTNQNLDP